MATPGEFKEDQHPRGPGGKFAPKRGDEVAGGTGVLTADEDVDDVGRRFVGALNDYEGDNVFEDLVRPQVGVDEGLSELIDPNNQGDAFVDMGGRCYFYDEKSDEWSGGERDSETLLNELHVRFANEHSPGQDDYRYFDSRDAHAQKDGTVVFGSTSQQGVTVVDESDHVVVYQDSEYAEYAHIPGAHSDAMEWAGDTATANPGLRDVIDPEKGNYHTEARVRVHKIGLNDGTRFSVATGAGADCDRDGPSGTYSTVEVLVPGNRWRPSPLDEYRYGPDSNLYSHVPIKVLDDWVTERDGVAQS